LIKSRRVRWVGNARYEEEKCIECLVGKPEIKIQLRGARCRYADNIEVNFIEVR
jgi:hypothetical protein